MFTRKDLEVELKKRGYQYQLPSTGDRTINMIKKNIAKIEIVSYSTFFTMVVSLKTSYGGYKISEHIKMRSIAGVIEAIEIAFNNPVIKKTKSRPKDKRGMIFQNILARVIKDTAENGHCNVERFASTENEVCRVNLPFMALKINEGSVGVRYNRISVHKFARVLFDISSPSFDPSKLAADLVNLDKRLREENKVIDDFVTKAIDKM